MEPRFKRLPDSSLSQDFSSDQDFWVSTGFAYQSKTNDYKVVKLWTTPVVAEVYSLSSDSWRSVEILLRSNVVAFYIDFFTSAQFVSGALHWLAEGEFPDQKMILSFDVDNDKFGEVAHHDGD